MSEAHPEPHEPVVLASAPNFRDLGGLSAEDGRRVRPGRLYRSSGLEELTSDEATRLTGALGLRTLIDLRSPGEVREDGVSPLDVAVIRYHNLPVSQTAGAFSQERPRDEQGRVDMARVYLDYLAHSSGSIVRALEILAEPGALPAVFHCAAGKDRTGVVAALLLRSIGVTRQAVVDDFAGSSARMDELLAYLLRRPSYARTLPRLPGGVMSAESYIMERFLTSIERQHGGAHAWLVQAGLDPQALTHLAEALLEPEPSAPAEDEG